MVALRNYNMGKNVNFTFAWNIFPFFFLIWSYLTYNYMSPLFKSLENMYKQDREWNTKFNRLLARHKHLRELDNTKLREKLPDISSYKSERNAYDNQSAYSGVKIKASNNVDIYMKNYKKRYMRKRGLSKLDCYCENKLFGKINYICDIGKRLKDYENSAKKIFLRKYGIVLILFALTPVLGLIFPILFGGQELGRGIISYCLREDHQSDTSSCTRKYKWYKYKTTIETIGYFSYIFFSIIGVIVSLVLIYILIKVIKYERLKEGRDKMGVKEYCRFAKDIFI